MADYTGSRCIVCSEQFREGDDIVVCPECGTPYHRACYEKYGSCVNTELHKAHRSWTPMPDTGVQTDVNEDDPEKDCVCPRCGYVNPKLTAFCGRCGSPMPALERHNEELRKNMEEAMKNDGDFGGINLEPYLINFTDPLCGYNPDEDFDGVRLCELADYVGSNTHYYLPNFKRFKDTGSSLSWNFSAMLIPEMYFSYRKMPLIALAALIVRVVFMIPQYIPILAEMDLAQQCHMSETHFRRIFQKKMNMTPIEYVNFVRVKKACELIDKTDISMEEVAEKVGFITPSTFNRNFRKIIGTSPYQWKKRPDNHEGKLQEYRISALKGW